MVCGLIIPKLSMVIAWIGVFGRIFYIIGYIFKGANGRLFGAFFNLIPNYVITIIALVVLITGSFKSISIWGAAPLVTA